MADDDDAASTGPEEIYTLDQCLERFVSEVDNISRDQIGHTRRLETALRSQFLALRRDLRMQFARELNAVRTEVRTECRFAPFRKLPPEVRDRIWSLALPWRVVEFRTNFVARAAHPGGGPPPPPGTRPTAPNGPVLNSSRLPPPALAHVCHESRQVALRHGRLMRTKIVEEQLPSAVWGQRSGPPPPPPGMGPMMPPGLNGMGAMGPSLYQTGWTWFSPKRDWIKLPAHIGGAPPPRPPGSPASPVPRGVGGIDVSEQEVWKQLMGDAEKVLIRRPLSDGEFERVAERVAFGAFPALRTIGIVVTHEVVQPRRSMVLETRLFGDDPFIFVDMKNQEEVDRVAAIFASDPFESKVAERWAEHAEAVRAGQPWTSRFFPWSSARDEGLLVAWIRAKHRQSPVTVPLSALIDPEDSAFEDEDHPWIQEELRAMPEIRIMHLFILDDNEGRDLKRLYGNTWSWRLNMMAVS
jgi:hypothetical protein